MKELNEAVRNITRTMRLQRLKGNTDADFILKHLPEVRR